MPIGIVLAIGIAFGLFVGRYETNVFLTLAIAIGVGIFVGVSDSVWKRYRA